MRWLTAFCCLCFALPGQAGELYLTSRGPAKAPSGWLEFCTNYPAECAVHYQKAEVVTLSPERLHELEDVNAHVNSTVKAMTDQHHWGRMEQWNFAEDGFGDCEEYALLKKRLLAQKGWPRSALLLAAVIDKSGDGHAVLVVRTSKGDFILDNQEQTILHWSVAKYRFLKRQSAYNPNQWMAIEHNISSAISILSN